jgi:hypothetical protein
MIPLSELELYPAYLPVDLLRPFAEEMTAWKVSSAV